MEISKWYVKRMMNGVTISIYLKGGFSGNYLDFTILPSLVIKLRRGKTVKVRTINFVFSWLIFTIGMEFVW